MSKRKTNVLHYKLMTMLDIIKEVVYEYNDFVINLFIYMFIDNLFKMNNIFMIIAAPFYISLYSLLFIVAIFAIPYEHYVKYKRLSK